MSPKVNGYTVSSAAAVDAGFLQSQLANGILQGTTSLYTPNLQVSRIGRKLSFASRCDNEVMLLLTAASGC